MPHTSIYGRTSENQYANLTTSKKELEKQFTATCTQELEADLRHTQSLNGISNGLGWKTSAESHVANLEFTCPLIATLSHGLTAVICCTNCETVKKLIENWKKKTVSQVVTKNAKASGHSHGLSQLKQEHADYKRPAIGVKLEQHAKSR